MTLTEVIKANKEEDKFDLVSTEFDKTLRSDPKKAVAEIALKIAGLYDNPKEMRRARILQPGIARAPVPEVMKMLEDEKKQRMNYFSGKVQANYRSVVDTLSEGEGDTGLVQLLSTISGIKPVDGIGSDKARKIHNKAYELLIASQDPEKAKKNYQKHLDEFKSEGLKGIAEKLGRSADYRTEVAEREAEIIVEEELAKEIRSLGSAQSYLRSIYNDAGDSRDIAYKIGKDAVAVDRGRKMKIIEGKIGLAKNKNDFKRLAEEAKELGFRLAA